MDFREALAAVDVVGLSYAEAGRLLGANAWPPERDQRSTAGAAR